MLEFLEKADEKIKKKFKYQLYMLVTENRILREPHIKHFIIERYRLFYEFRIKVSKKVVRIIFCERDDNIVLLHAFYKHDKRDTEKALEYSIKLYDKLASGSLLLTAEVFNIKGNTRISYYIAVLVNTKCNL